MSDEGEQTCPLCAEEMDLTDQQLKPCKCGYDICVWCWHHIMDMAEKDNSEGRCPACRTPYDKEKIVGTTSKCERLVAEMSVEKKQKSQKGKTKTPEGRKQLTSVRVIQRNLVYIVGLPLNLADEDLLQQKEYFGRYGKVLKVSISRTAAGAIQHFANNTCSVYITYSKEDEAVRSIQAVHGFVLEGRPLRACFGTTKYCHAWLRSVPCTNPDCLYLHEFGSQEDSFTKDEIVSEHTRVQQVTGATNDMQRRSGNNLPPPVDDHYNNSTFSGGKPISRSTTNDSANSMKGSPPHSSSGRSVALPAAASWGTRASNSQPLPANGPTKQKADASTLSFSTAVVSPILHGNEVVKNRNMESHTLERKGKMERLESVRLVTGTNHRKMVSETPVTSGSSSTSTSSSQLVKASPKDKNRSVDTLPNLSGSLETTRQSFVPFTEKDLNVKVEGRVQRLSSDMSRNQGIKPCDAENYTESLAAEKASDHTADSSVTREQSYLLSDLQSRVAQVAINEAEADLLSFNDQRLRDPEVVTHTSYVQNLPQSSSHLSNSTSYSPRQAYVSVNGSLDPPFVDQKLEKGSFHIPVVNGYSSNLVGSSVFESSNGHPYFPSTQGGRKQMGSFDDDAPEAKKERHTASDLGESSIISNILSMDFDPWDESLTSPRNMAKLLGDSDKQLGSHKVSSSRKAQNNNQSRFSFARDDECIDQEPNSVPILNDYGRGHNRQSFSRDFVGNRDTYSDMLSDGNGFSSFSFEDSDTFSSNHSTMSSNKISVSRTQISAPPGFLGPSRAPPPGFPSHERMEHTFDNQSGNHMFDAPSLLRKAHQVPSPVYNNGDVSDLEFMDPAILAVGGRVSGGLDMRSNFPTQLSNFENDTRLQLLMQRSFAQQNRRFPELDTYPQRTDSYGISSRIVEQTIPNNRSPYHHANFQQPRNPPMSDGRWDGWNEVPSGNDIAMAEILRNERLGFNKNYYGYEDAKFRLPNSGDLYNRTFGI